MTVYDFLISLQLGVEYDIPSNCSFDNLAYEARQRFGWKLVKVGDNKLKRVCPTCGR